MPRKIHIGPNGGRYINYYGKKKYLSNLSQFGGGKEEREQENNRQLDHAQNPVTPSIDTHNLDHPAILPHPAPLLAQPVRVPERAAAVAPAHVPTRAEMEAEAEAAARIAALREAGIPLIAEGPQEQLRQEEGLAHWEGTRYMNQRNLPEAEAVRGEFVWNWMQLPHLRFNERYLQAARATDIWRLLVPGPRRRLDAALQAHRERLAARRLAHW